MRNMRGMIYQCRSCHKVWAYCPDEIEDNPECPECKGNKTIYVCSL